jgi:Carbohydrate-selective porin, OprB family
VRKAFAISGLLMLLLSSVTARQALALQQEFKIPEMATAKVPACREILRLAKKYDVEGVLGALPKGFETGENACPRLDLAVALQLIIDRMAEKVAKEGPAAVGKTDLDIVSEIREELRGEMLLVQARTFRVQTAELGTRLHALTRDISLSGGLTGILQGSLGNHPKDHVDAVGRAELLFNFKAGENTIAVVDFSATGGDGPDPQVPNLSTLNDVAGSTGDRVTVRKAWLEHAAFNGRLVITAGKIGLEDYFDANEVANDGNTQFLANAFVNSAVLGQPEKGPGLRIQAKVAEPLTVSFGLASGDADTTDIFDHPYAIAEGDYAAKIAGRRGNYRLYVDLDGALPDGTDKLVKSNALGFGVSIDQQVTGNLTLFGRYGRREGSVYRKKSAWSAGFQYAGPIPSRSDDVLGFAFGQVQATGSPAEEKLAELYYKVKVNDHIDISPVAQYLINPDADRNLNNVAVLGLRTWIIF